MYLSRIVRFSTATSIVFSAQILFAQAPRRTASTRADSMVVLRTELQRLRRQNDSLRGAPSPAVVAGTRETLTALKSDLSEVQSEIVSAQARDDSLAGGLIKAQVQMRIELLRTTETLIRQRIQAIESGARVTLSVPGVPPDPSLAAALESEIRTQEEALQTARADAARYSGGLVLAMKESTIATQEQTLAMLRGRYLSAKYGLATPTQGRTDDARVTTSRPRPRSTASDLAETILTARILSKRFSEQDYQSYIFFDIEFTAGGLDKPTRAIKGTLDLQDLFGESKMKIGWTIDQPVAANAVIVEKGSGFKYNQFMSDHKWVRSTDVQSMTTVFRVQSILYADGTRRDF